MSEYRLAHFKGSGATYCYWLRKNTCCILQPAIGCWALRKLVKICFFNVFVQKSWKRKKKQEIGSKFKQKIGFLNLHQNAGQGFWEIKYFSGNKTLDQPPSVVFVWSQYKFCIKFFTFFFFSAFLLKKCWKNIFEPAFGVHSTQNNSWKIQQIPPD